MSILDQHGKPINPKPDCDHDKHMPKVPEDEVLFAMDVSEIREKHPRFMGRCDDCGQQVILYGSYAQYIAGDW